MKGEKEMLKEFKKLSLKDKVELVAKVVTATVALIKLLKEIF